MNLTMLSDLESLYGEDPPPGEIVAFVRRRPLPPAERRRRAIAHAHRWPLGREFGGNILQV